MNTEAINQTYPRLETKRLVLRAFGMDDVDFIFKEYSDPQVCYYLRDEEPLKNLEQAKEMLIPWQTPEKYPDFKWWGIEYKANGELIGSCGYRRWDKQHHRAEVGYDLWPTYWGKGIVPEALEALFGFGFLEMGLNRIEANTHIENVRSQRVLVKHGFQREGILRDYYCLDGHYNDQIQFSLLRREWQKKHPLTE